MPTATPALSRDFREWLEPDGIGGFASGTVCGIRTRRYHALLLAAVTPPTGRIVLVNGLESWIEIDGAVLALNSQRYTPDVVYADGASRIASFSSTPWPTWRFNLPGGRILEHGVLVQPGHAATTLYWRFALGSSVGARLSVRPLVSGRDYHATHHENPAFNFAAIRAGDRVVMHPYHGVPGIAMTANALWEPAPEWYRNFLYAAEAYRGLDSVEDLAAPGIFHFDLAAGDAVLTLAVEGDEPNWSFDQLCAMERARRAAFSTPLERAADAYIVRRGAGKTIIAGYPWFTDWGRDTFVSLRGLCLSAGRLADARAILLEWAGAVSRGMMPNRFPDRGGAPEFNSVDSSLWYAIAVHALLHNAPQLPAADRDRLLGALLEILEGYRDGTRYNIHAESGGLLAAGVPGVQLTWMDAKAGDWVVTPRIGKPVEVQALWINALRIGAAFDPKWMALFEQARDSFAKRFWNEERGCLFDVIDCDHRPDVTDPAIRPNQIFAVGGLPFQILDGDRARRVVEIVQARLLTPIGLRSLAPDDPAYAPHYRGDQRSRDGAYHQGTVWPWLMGPFIEAWVRVNGDSAATRIEARRRFLEPLLAHLDDAGLGHLPEIADGDPPHAARGCPFQAWSVAEALRISAWLDGAA